MKYSALTCVNTTEHNSRAAYSKKMNELCTF